MRLTTLIPAVLVLLLVGCGPDQPAEKEAKSFGAGVGESYKSLTDDARLSVEQINAQMDRTDQRIRERQE